jgi:hypothetical protein
METFNNHNYEFYFLSTLTYEITHGSGRQRQWWLIRSLYLEYLARHALCPSTDISKAAFHDNRAQISWFLPANWYLTPGTSNLMTLPRPTDDKHLIQRCRKNSNRFFSLLCCRVNILVLLLCYKRDLSSCLNYGLFLSIR